MPPDLSNRLLKQTAKESLTGFGGWPILPVLLRMLDTACFFAIPHQVREEGGLVPVLDTGPLKDRRYRQSQEKAQLSKKGLSGRALSEG